MFYNVENFTLLLVKYKLTANQFLFAYLLHEGKWDALKKYVDKEKGLGLFSSADLKVLKDNGYIIDINQEVDGIQKTYMDSFICTSTFKELMFLDTDEPINELMDVYPNFIEVDGKNYAAKNIDPSLLGPTYVKNINADCDKHIEVLALTQYAVKYNLIVTDLGSYVKSRMWEGIKEAKDFIELTTTNSSKIYFPTDIMPFGKNKNLSFSEIYQYQPNYIEWLIFNIPEFRINVEEFEKLPDSTPFYGGYVEGSENANKYSKNIDDWLKYVDRNNKHVNVSDIKKLIDEGFKAEAVNFKFSEEALERNGSKTKKFQIIDFSDSSPEIGNFMSF